MPFKFTTTELDGVILVEPRSFADPRGYFMESYKQSEFIANGISAEFVQDNHSYSVKDVIRGLHFQRNPMAQGKLVRVIQGSVWDVAVDIRPESKNYKKWYAVELNDKNNFMLYIPEGFAHGFLTLSDTVHLAYKCTKEYSPVHDGGIIWNDPDLAVSWPVNDPLLSDKDAVLPRLGDILK